MTSRPPSDQIAIAKAIATVAHRGQTDKAGNPYIGHPERVAATLTKLSPNSAERIAAGWLHDVLEDTDVTAEDLKAAGVEELVIYWVTAVTRNPGESVESYYERIRKVGRGAMDVKLADIEDNSSVERLALLDDETVVRLTRKYAKALLLLGRQS